MAQRKLEPGEKSKILKDCLHVARFPIIDLNDPVKVYKRIEEYFQFCIDNDTYATVAGMATALNVSRQAVDQWINGKIKKDPEVVRAVEWGKSVINSQNEGAIMEGKGHVVGQIFLMKNNFDNYTDTREVVMKRAMPELTAEQLLAEAAKLPGFDQKRIGTK